MLRAVKAAVVRSFEAPPDYADFPAPVAEVDELLVDVEAAALSQLVRAQASGKHYSGASVPLVPGADGVGTVAGKRVYFAFPRPPVGAMAERVAVKRQYCVELPDDVDSVAAAAAANPGMSSWAALTRRARLQRGESVLINGATGASGRLAIQVAKHLGARRVIATGRAPGSEAALRALGADAFIPLNQPSDALSAAFRSEIQGEGVDVVLDYLFGNTTEAFVSAALGSARGVAEPRIRFVQIGSLAGANISLPAAALRSSGLELLGTGLGALSNAELVTCIGELFQVYTKAGFRVDARAMPLSEVTTSWNGQSSARLVYTN